MLDFCDFRRLQILEDSVLDAGVDGGQITSDAIEFLERLEIKLGVFREGAIAPRWRDYRGSLKRLGFE